MANKKIQNSNILIFFLVIWIIFLTGINVNKYKEFLLKPLGINDNEVEVGRKNEVRKRNDFITEFAPASEQKKIPSSTSYQKKESTSSNEVTQEIEWGQTIKIDEKTSVSRFASDDHMSTVAELNQAMNQYRQSHGLPTLNFDSVLCNIAQARANQLQVLGKLDGHAGAYNLVHDQQSFDTIDEVLFGGVQPVIGVHIVEWGWDQSLTGHHVAISNPLWRDGCAGIAGYFAVFEFGAK